MFQSQRPPQMMKEITSPQRRGGKKNGALPVIFVLLILLLGALAAAGYFFYQYKHSGQVKDAKEIEDITKEIGEFMLLPEGEKPTLATVTDKEKLAEQAFFQRAENGDKVLIFSQSGRAILYRPSIKKIIDTTTVSLNQAAGTEAESSAQSTPTILRLGILNGTDEEGRLSSTESAVQSILPNSVAVVKTSAKQKYESTTVVDVSGNNSDVANQIAATLKGKVGSLPAGENVPADTDIVIIVGTTPVE